MKGVSLPGDMTTKLYADIQKLRWYDIPCYICGQEETNSWDKRCSRAVGHTQIVCEDCLAKEYGMTVEELRSTMRSYFGLIPCPGI